MAGVIDCPGCGELRKELAILRAEIRDLRARLNLTSRNSSKPPSSDPPSVAPKPSAPTGRKPGGQPGHEGHRRQEFRREEIDHRVEIEAERCESCRAALVGARREEPDVVQVVEIPPAVAEVTEYILFSHRCPRCAHVTTASLPPGVEGAIGPRFQAALTLLSGQFRLSRREAASAALALFGPKARVSVGWVSALEARTSEALAAAHEEAARAVQSAPVAHADETSFPQRAKKGWLWTASTREVAYFHHDEERSRKAAEFLLGEFTGTLCVDRWVSYRHHPKQRRQICYAHLKRNFQELVDRGEPAAEVGRAGLAAVVGVFDLWAELEAGRITFRSLRRRVSPVRLALWKALVRGESNADQKAAALSKDLVKLFPCLWTFTRRRGVPLTNNLAERRLRPAVLWRKGSFGTWSARGSRFVERILTVVQTLRAQGRSVLDFLAQAILAARLGQSPPPLLPG